MGHITDNDGFSLGCGREGEVHKGDRQQRQMSISERSVNAETFGFSIAGSGVDAATLGTDFNGTLVFSSPLPTTVNARDTATSGLAPFP